MNEFTAIEKHSCAACGAQAEWDPGRQALTCPYCGTISPYEFDRETGEIQEIDLVRTLREMPEELRGWKAEKRTVRCRSCNAVSVFDPTRVAQNCEFCGSPELVDYEELKAPISPQSLLPFKISEVQIRENLRHWFEAKWFAPGKLKRRALIDTVHGVYIPYWTFDAETVCHWTAESGYYYYVTETFRDSNGRTQSRQVRKTRWQPSSGRVDHFFDDEPVPGTHSLNPDLLGQIEPFPTSDLLAYDTGYISGFVVEHYQVVLIEAAREAREQMKGELYRLCSQQVPGDTFRSLEIDPSFSGETFKHILVPVWLLNYDFGKRRFQVLVNGYSGTIAGQYPKSLWKIFFLILSLVFLGLLLLFIID